MNRLSKLAIFTMAALLFGNLLLTGAKIGLAQQEGAPPIQSPPVATAIAPSQTETGSPACWVAIGNKLYFVEKDDTAILKVKASGAL